jgi:hypothetical protein
MVTVGRLRIETDDDGNEIGVGVREYQFVTLQRVANHLRSLGEDVPLAVVEGWIDGSVAQAPKGSALREAAKRLRERFKAHQEAGGDREAAYLETALYCVEAAQAEETVKPKRNGKAARGDQE